MEQLSLDLPEVEASIKPYTVPKAKRRKAEKYKAHPRGKLLEPNDPVTLIHRTGRVKQVYFARVAANAAWVIWPIALEQIAVSLDTGDVRMPITLSEWRLERTALAVARRMYRDG